MPPTDSNNEKSSILKRTREAKGLTIEIVHEATKIPMDALRAIEEGYSVRILSPFYYRGFIKIYSEFLGLEVAEIYKQYGLDGRDKPALSVTIPVKSSRSQTAKPSIVLEQTQELFFVFFKPKNIKLIIKIAGFLFLIFLLFKIGGCVISQMNKKAGPSLKQSAFNWKDKKVKVREVAQEEKSVPVTQEIKHEALQAQSENNKVEVAVRAMRNTWIQVKADGKVVFQMTLSKGSTESWSADDRIELSGKNIDQLDMEVNGKHIGSLGGAQRRIRKVLITKEGLTVKK
jgi:cytoskeletal protein RodZ